jgi:hypothetical protein
MIRRDDLPERRVRRRSGLAQQARHESHLEHPEPERAPRLTGEQADDLLQPRLEHVGRPEKDPLPLRRHALRPGGERLGRGRNRTRRVRTGARGDERDDVARERVAVFECPPAVGGLPVAGDEVLVLANVLLNAGHVPLLSIRARS